MKIISWNVNGLRAVERKEALSQMIERENPDVLLLQEIKMSEEHALPFVEKYSDYKQVYNHAEKKGYSGTGVWLKKGLEGRFKKGMPHWNDREGRVVRVDVGEFSVLGVYFPNGGKSPEAWDEKLRFYDCFLDYINDLRENGRRVVWGGDINCAHAEIDLARPKANDGKIGFHPKERAWVSKCVEQKWADVWRVENPEIVKYSWWSMRGGARSRNVGWRIDYFFVDEGDLAKVENVSYQNDQMGSDHCPMLIEII